MWEGGCGELWAGGGVAHASPLAELPAPPPRRAARSGFMNEREGAAPKASSADAADRKSAAAAVGLMGNEGV